MLLSEIKEIRDGRLIAKDSLPTITFQSIKCTIETDKGQIREGIGYNNQPFKVTMICPYGFIENTLGTDGEGIDCFIGPDAKAEDAFIIWEKATGEEKVMFGFPSQLDAVDAFCKHYYPNPLDFLGTVTRMKMDDFKKILAAMKPGARLTQDGSGYTRVSENSLQLVASALNHPKTEVFVDRGAVRDNITIREQGRGTKHFDTNKEAYDYLHERLLEEVKSYK